MIIKSLEDTNTDGSLKFFPALSQFEIGGQMAPKSFVSLVNAMHLRSESQPRCSLSMYSCSVCEGWNRKVVELPTFKLRTYEELMVLLPFTEAYSDSKILISQQDFISGVGAGG